MTPAGTDPKAVSVHGPPPTKQTELIIKSLHPENKSPAIIYAKNKYQNVVIKNPLRIENIHRVRATTLYK